MYSESVKNIGHKPLCFYHTIKLFYIIVYRKYKFFYEDFISAELCSSNMSGERKATNNLAIFRNGNITPF